jgi:hypothetical protein
LGEVTLPWRIGSCIAITVFCQMAFEIVALPPKAGQAAYGVRVVVVCFATELALPLEKRDRLPGGVLTVAFNRYFVPQYDKVRVVLLWDMGKVFSDFFVMATLFRNFVW